MRIVVLHYDDNINEDLTNNFDMLGEQYKLYAHCWCKPVSMGNFSASIADALKNNKATQKIIFETCACNSDPNFFLRSIRRICDSVDMNGYDIIVLSAYKYIAISENEVDVMRTLGMTDVWMHGSSKLFFFGKTAFETYRNMVNDQTNNYKNEKEIFDDLVDKIKSIK